MKVFKFGGASVKDAESVKNVLRIVQSVNGEEVIVVISAMGKTTNRLEQLLKAHFDGEETDQYLEEIRTQHTSIATELFGTESKPIVDDINNILVEVEWALDDPDGLDERFQYDQIVSIGEMLSTSIVSAFLNKNGIVSIWVDARDLIRTDNTYKNARVDWEETEKMTATVLGRALKKAPVVVTQGFIGGTSENFTTTLGREGSDFTAAILAYCVDAEEVTIWKDVPGVLNADPKFFENTELIPNMNYRDAVELAYFGTSVIHPKTVKPLQNKGIPLCVRSFKHPEKQGTVIDSSTSEEPMPNFIVKEDQTLVSIQPRDFSFIVESNLQHIFQVLGVLQIRTNVMQNSALSFSFSMDDSEPKLVALQDQLSPDFEVKFNRGCRLLTVRYFTDAILGQLIGNSKTLLEQRTRNTAQLVLAD